ncbi:MAG TPA: CAAX prenyl protease-related protein [Aquabacterium sp.]|uniref:CAAX prenyl protease-related protein n=1 Tax=Aquabacterium sp. TaxID=1872578 RepID=UPI002E37C2F9|nr:CAAX prenyl protease-related protein [Aquabacterium sp.]HEX5372394.1 CAAX prenyl protease-related protein [Aquabacterium sp.]
MERLISPAGLARCVPFFLFMALLALRGQLPADGSGFIDPRWVYGLSVLVVSGSLLWFWRRYGELARGLGLSWQEWLLSIAVGVVVYLLWVRLDHPWMMLGEATASFKPVDAEGQLIWSLVIVRWIGAALMVPVMEELFWRSFLMRWVDNPDFEQVDPRRTTLKAVVLSTVVFMLAHTQWLAAIVAGLAYAWLYRRTGKLWAPIVAHAVTNGVLGIWVVIWGNWQFW